MRTRILLVLFLVATAANAATSTSRTKAVVNGPIQMAAATSNDYPLMIVATMEHVRLKGTLRASGGSGNDIELFVFRESDYLNWKNGHAAPTLLKSGRTTIAEVDLELQPGAYRLVLSNVFSAFTPKAVAGSLTLSWDEDASLPSGPDLKKLVNFKAVPPQAARVEVPFRAGASAGRVVIERDGEVGPYSITVSRPRGATTLEKVVGEMASDRITEVGTVDVGGDKIEDVLVVGESAGSGAGSKELIVVSTTKLALVSLVLFQTYQATEATAEVTYSDNFADPQFRSEQSFLERIKGAYAATAEDEIAGKEDDPRMLFYTWAKDNGSVQDGSLTIRRYPGRPAEFGSVNDELTDGSITYYALFKAGVIAYDAAADEHYALFHPKDMYAWPTVLKKLGPHLLIGTRGEGLAIVDTKRMTLRRVRVARANEVEKIEVVGSKLRINGIVEIGAPAY